MQNLGLDENHSNNNLNQISLCQNSMQNLGFDENHSNKTEIPVFYTLMTKTDLTQLIAIAVKEAFEAKQGLEIAPNLNPDELLTRKEAAKEFKVCVATIDNYKNKGLLIPSRLSGTVRYRRGDLQAAFSGSILNPYKAPKGKRS